MSALDPAPLPRPETPQRTNWRGIALPVVRSSGDYWASKKTLDLVWSSIITILGTPIGSRIMLPEFGSRLPELTFEMNDDVLIALANRYIIDAIGRWEPRVSIQDVHIQIAENTFTIGMQFIVETIEGAQQGTLVLYRNQSFKVLEQFFNQIS